GLRVGATSIFLSRRGRRAPLHGANTASASWMTRRDDVRTGRSVCRRVVVENLVRGHGDQNCACREPMSAASQPLFMASATSAEFTGSAADNAGPEYAVRLRIEQQLGEPLLASEAERPQGQAPFLTGVP